jgi:hypothetical protein
VAKTKNVLLRLPLDIAAELEQAEYDEHRTATEILLQAAVIRLRLVTPTSLGKLLEKAGYQERRAAGRPRQAVPAEANGHDPEASADAVSAPWSLEP